MPAATQPGDACQDGTADERRPQPPTPTDDRWVTRTRVIGLEFWRLLEYPITLTP